MKLFEELGLNKDIVRKIQKLGYDTPTQIQKKSIPLIISGKDIMGESSTGSGKTLAFGCGIIDKVIPNKGIQALVLTPTRELAEQVKEYIKDLSHDKQLNIISIYGGVAMGPQIHNLKSANVIVATPGRLLDHMGRKTIDLSKVKLLVLDEVDRILDMGFIDDVREIIKACPAKRQTLFFSATISQEIRSLSKNYMIDPILILAEKQVDPSKLKQVYYSIDKNAKLSLLVYLVKNEKSGLIMVFCNTRRNTDFVVKTLKVNKINAIAIHGGLSQNKRTRTIDLFHGAKVGVLVCTDVAARGLHIDDVSHIYNYDIPRDPKDYVHRIGRTARAGKKGKVINLLCEFDYDNFSRIEREYRNFKVEKMNKPHIERIIIPKKTDSRDNKNRFFNRHRKRNNSFRRR